MKPRLYLLAVLAAVGATATAGTAAARMAAVHGGSPIDGRWETSITRADLLRIGEKPAAAVELYGPYTATFANGRFVVRNGRTGHGAKGTFRLSGELVRFVFASGVGVEPGDVGFCSASVYRDKLTFARKAGRPCFAWNAAVWKRIS
jgi:hypothetical protein